VSAVLAAHCGEQGGPGFLDFDDLLGRFRACRLDIGRVGEIPGSVMIVAWFAIDEDDAVAFGFQAP